MAHCQYGCMTSDALKCVHQIASSLESEVARLRDENTAAITAAERALLEELIPLVCSRCKSDFQPKRLKFARPGKWVHMIGMTTNDYCPASSLHESIYQREQRAADGPADAD